MADLHFEVHCASAGPRIRNLSKETPTLVNGEELGAMILLADGDEIVAGGTSFAVSIEGAAAQPPQDARANTNTESSPPEDAGALAVAPLVATCAYLQLSDDVQQLAAADKTGEELIDALVAEQQYPEALRLRAYLLPKRAAVWWGCVCVREDVQEPLDVEQAVALEAAIAWVADPQEDRRRECDRLAEAAASPGPGVLLARSAFWSEGSITPPDAPETPADERLTCQGVAAALIIAAYLGDPAEVESRMLAFFEKGIAVAEERIPFPAQ